MERLHAQRGVVAGPVRLGTGTAISMYLLPPLLRTLRARHPAVDLIVTTGTAPEVVRAVAEADLDVGVVGLPVRARELVVAPFVVDEFVAIAARRHWRSRGPIDAAALRDERLILDQPGATSRRLVDAWLHRRGVVPIVPAELGNTEATKELVSAGLGVSIASWFWFAGKSRPGAWRAGGCGRHCRIRWVSCAGAIRRPPRRCRGCWPGSTPSGAGWSARAVLDANAAPR